MRCGKDLVHQRAVRDPHYGLPLVICPRCGWACARRQPGWCSRRRRRKIIGITITLGSQGVFLFLLTVCTLAILATVLETQHNRSSSTPQWEQALLYFWAYLIAPAIVGIWLTTGLRHVNRTFIFMLWLVWILIFPFLSVVSDMITELCARGSDGSIRFSLRQWKDEMRVPIRGFLFNHLLMFGSTIVIGLPAGWLVRPLLEKHRRRRRSILRTSLRKRRGHA